MPLSLWVTMISNPLMLTHQPGLPADSASRKKLGGSPKASLKHPGGAFISF